MKLKKVHDATAAGLTELLKNAMAEIIPGLGTTQYIVGFGADGVSVNMGVRKDIAVRLQDDYPRHLPIHCFNHRLELAVKDALSKTFHDDVIDILTSLYYLYHASGKRQREVQELTNIKMAYKNPRSVMEPVGSSISCKPLKHYSIHTG